MQRQWVKSKAIRSVGYDADLRVLELHYVDGGIYQYLDVPVDVHARLLTAPSIGRFVATEIKPHYQVRPT